MHTLNIIISNIQGQIKLVYDPYKNSLDNILDSNINNIVAKIVYIKPWPLRQSASITQPYILQNINILQLSGNFDQVSSRKDKHSSFFVKVKSCSWLPPSIVPLNYFIINTSSISDN